MEITAEAVGQQLELQKMYRDDKFAEKLRELQAQYKQTQNAQRALDERKKDLMAREKICDVIQGSQKTFNEQKAAAEAHNLVVSQRNQSVKDELAAQTKALEKTADETNAAKAEISKELKKTVTARKSAETKALKAEDALQAAEDKQAKWENRLLELGLKPAA